MYAMTAEDREQLRLAVQKVEAARVELDKALAQYSRAGGVEGVDWARLCACHDALRQAQETLDNEERELGRLRRWFSR